MTIHKTENILKFIFKKKKKDGQEKESTISTLQLVKIYFRNYLIVLI